MITLAVATIHENIVFTVVTVKIAVQGDVCLIYQPGKKAHQNTPN